MKKIKKNKKQTYLLLELLLSFFLLTLFLAPLLNSPLAVLRKQNAEKVSLFLSFEETKLLFLIEERLRTGEIQWDTLQLAEKEPVLLETIDVKIPQDKNTYQAELFLLKSSLKKEQEICFGTVKAAVTFFKGPKTPLKKKRATLDLFVLQKQRTAPHAP